MKAQEIEKEKQAGKLIAVVLIAMALVLTAFFAFGNVIITLM